MASTTGTAWQDISPGRMLLAGMPPSGADRLCISVAGFNAATGFDSAAWVPAKLLGQLLP